MIHFCQKLGGNCLMRMEMGLEADLAAGDPACLAYRQGMEHMRRGEFAQAEGVIAILQTMEPKYWKSMVAYLEVAKRWARAVGEGPPGQAFWEWLDQQDF